METFDNFAAYLVLYCIVLSCPVLSCLVSSCLVASCIVLYCPVLSCLAMPCIALYCRVVSCLVWACLMLYGLVVSRMVLSGRGLSRCVALGIATRVYHTCHHVCTLYLCALATIVAVARGWLIASSSFLYVSILVR